MHDMIHQVIYMELDKVSYKIRPDFEGMDTRQLFHFYPRPPSAPVGIVVGPSVCSCVPNDVPDLTLLQISAISLKFGGMMHGTMEHITLVNGLARSIFVCSTELWNIPW